MQGLGLWRTAGTAYAQCRTTETQREEVSGGPMQTSVSHCR